MLASNECIDVGCAVVMFVSMFVVIVRGLSGREVEGSEGINFLLKAIR